MKLATQISPLLNWLYLCNGKVVSRTLAFLFLLSVMLDKVQYFVMNKLFWFSLAVVSKFKD